MLVCLFSFCDQLLFNITEQPVFTKLGSMNNDGQ